MSSKLKTKKATNAADVSTEFLSKSKLGLPLLQRALAKVYASSTGGKPASKMMKDLEEKTIVVQDKGLSEETIDILCKFFATKEALTGLETLILTKQLSEKAIGGQVKDKKEVPKEKKDPRGSNSNPNILRNQLNQNSFQAKKGALMKAVCKFIANSTSLRVININSIRVNLDTLPLIGQAMNDNTTGVLRWLSIKSCNIGDEGLKSLTPFICRTSLQVLLLDDVGLSDESSKYVCSILKANEAKMDSLIFQASLRDYTAGYTNSSSSNNANTSKDNNFLADEAKNVYGKGLLAIGLPNNKITDMGVASIARQLKRDSFLCGFDIRNNAITTDGMTRLIDSLQANNVMGLLLHGNIGFSEEVCTQLGVKMTSRTFQNARKLHLLPAHIAAILKRFMKFQVMHEVYFATVPKTDLQNESNYVTNAASLRDHDRVDGINNNDDSFQTLEIVNNSMGGLAASSSDPLEKCIPTTVTAHDEFNGSFGGSPNGSFGTGSPGADVGFESRPPSRMSLRPRSVAELDSQLKGCSSAPAPQFRSSVLSENKPRVRAPRGASSLSLTLKRRSPVMSEGLTSRSVTALPLAPKPAASTLNGSTLSARSVASAAAKGTTTRGTGTPTRKIPTAARDSPTVKRLANSVHVITKSLESLSSQLKSVTSTLSTLDPAKSAKAASPRRAAASKGASEADKGDEADVLDAQIKAQLRSKLQTLMG